MLKHLNSDPIKPQRVVILGAGGFVGKTTLVELESNGFKVLGLTRKQFDLLKPNAAQDLSECLQENDALVVVSAIAPCKSTDMLMDNLKMMHAICKIVDQHKNKLSQIVYISSDAVYSDEVSLANESSATMPSSFHGVMHITREFMLKAAAGNYDIPLAILRSSVLYGTDDPHNGYGPNRFRRLAAEGKEIKLFGEGEEKRDHIYVADVANIVCLVLEHKSQGVLNIATGISTSFKQIAEAVVKVSRNQVDIVGSPRQNAVTHRHFDITACRKSFPKFQYTVLESGLERV